MQQKILSIRPFIGSTDFIISSNFYKDLGFEEVKLSEGFTYFKMQEFGFYLQDADVKDWIDNTMIFLEVEDVEIFWKELIALDLPAKYDNVRLVPVKTMDWGKECFVHDPSGILWHFGEFFNK